MDAHSNKEKRTKKIILSLSIVITFIIIGIILYPKNEEEFIKDNDHNFQARKSRKSKKSHLKLIRAKKKSSISEDKSKTFTELYLNDEKGIKHCVRSLKEVTKRDEDHNLIIKDYELAYQRLLVDCIFRFDSYKRMIELAQEGKFTLEMAQRNFLTPPTMLMSDVFSELLKNEVFFKKNKQNFYSILKMNIHLSTIRDRFSIYAWIGMTSFMLYKCNISNVMEGVYIGNDFRNEDDSLQDVAILTSSRRTLEDVNDYIIRRDKVYSEYQQRLKDFFNKYEIDIERCVQNER